jgi:uncharacterized protein
MPRFEKDKTLTLSDALKVTRPKAFMVMVKPIGPICNLNCSYCYYLEKENLYRTSKNFRMSDEVLESFIKQFIEAHEVPLVTFTWQGGEPTLLGLEYFEKVIALQKKYQGNKKIDNAFQTNGTRLTEDWCRFFSRNNFLVGISIDGPAPVHDRYRKNKAGKPTFDEVMKGIKLLKRFRVEFNTLTVINNANAGQPVEIYRFLKKTGSKFMQFIPIVERISQEPTAEGLTLVPPGAAGEASVADWTVRSRQYGKFMTSVFDEWVKNDVGQIFVQLFDVTLANWVGASPGLCVFAETCGEAAVMEHNGDLYSCDHFVYPEHFLGNILNQPLVEMMSSHRQIQFGKDKRDTLPRQCMFCEVRFACHGGCPKSRFAVTADGQPGLNWLCEGYKMFFNHVKPYMEFMSNELLNQRPPSNIMGSSLVKTSANKLQ